MVSDLELHIDLTMPSYNLDVNWIQTNSLTLIVLGGGGVKIPQLSKSSITQECT